MVGPVLTGTFTSSMEIPKRLLERRMPALPQLNFVCVDVRDVALAHIQAMTIPEAAGKRHIIANNNMWVADLAKFYDEEFTCQGYSIPTKTAPYFLLWLSSLFDKSIKMMLPPIGREINMDNTRMTEVLGYERNIYRHGL